MTAVATPSEAYARYVLTQVLRGDPDRVWPFDIVELRQTLAAIAGASISADLSLIKDVGLIAEIVRLHGRVLTTADVDLPSLTRDLSAAAVAAVVTACIPAGGTQ